MYLLYLDESGHSRIDRPGIREQSNFFVLGGLIIKEENYREIDEKFKDFKKLNFPKELIEDPLHSVELNNLSYKSESKYSLFLDYKQGKALLNKCYEFLATLPLEAISIIIDNHSLKKKYLYPENPYLLSYEFILEKFQKIISKRGDNKNQFGIVNLAECSKKLNSNIIKIHKKIMEEGTKYVKEFENVFNEVNIEPVKKSSYYEIADLICYAFQRSYYCWLCKNLGVKHYDEGYLKIIQPICTLEIGKIIFEGKIRLKVFPEVRFLKKSSE